MSVARASIASMVGRVLETFAILWLFMDRDHAVGWVYGAYWTLFALIVLALLGEWSKRARAEVSA